MFAAQEGQLICMRQFQGDQQHSQGLVWHNLLGCQVP